MLVHSGCVSFGDGGVAMGACERSWILYGLVGAGVLWAGGCDQHSPDSAPPLQRASALALPSPGQKVLLDFKADAFGNPLARGTVLAEQFAEWGIHFENGYVLGDRAVDFPDYTSPAPDNLVCTFSSSVHRADLVSWTDGRCAGGPASDAIPLVVDLDFKACAVQVAGSGLPITSILPTGSILITGYDEGGALKGSASSNEIIHVVRPGPPPVLISEGGGVDALPQAGISRLPLPAEPGLDLKKIFIQGKAVGAFDDLQITRCPALVPKCANQVICIPPGQACTSPAETTIDSGSYATDGGAILLSQAPAAPFPAGATPVVLTVAQGSNSATCSATVRVGDCRAPTLLCPPPTTIDSTWPCTDFTAMATVVDGCGSRTVGRNTNQCLSLGANVVVYEAASADGSSVGSCSTSVTVVDHQPPVVTVHDVGLTLTPPNGALRTISLADCGLEVRAADTGAILDPADFTATITCVDADESADQRSRNRCPEADIQIVDAQTVKLRAERDEHGDGRVYTIVIDVVDSAGAETQGVCQVGVPKGHRPAVDSGPRQSVCQ